MPTSTATERDQTGPLRAQETSARPRLRRYGRVAAIVVALVLVVAASTVGGFWASASVSERVLRISAIQRATSEASAVQRGLAQLDKGDAGALIQHLNMALDADLITMCGALADKNAPPEVTARAKAVVRRVGAYRREHPPTYPDTYARERPEVAVRMIRECVAAVLSAPDA